MTRVLFWVQNLLGSGHLGRAQMLYAALADVGFEVTLVNGGRALPWLRRPKVRVVDLPAVSAADLTFAQLVDEAGRPVDAAFWAERRRRLLDLFDRLLPAVVITEMFPFGRRAFRGELLPLLLRARARGALRVASVRDVLVQAEPAKYRWMRDMAREHYDLVLVHTDPRFLPFALTFPHRDELGDRLIETGFVAPDRAPSRITDGQGEVIVSAGGGRVGRALLETALEARALVSPPLPWRLIAAGEAEARSLARRARPGVVIDRQRPDFRDLLANGLLSVSQAGYNTVVEALAYEKRMVLVPFEAAGETEQQTRAGRLGELGLATVLSERDLGPEALAAAVGRALRTAPPVRPQIDLGGAAHSAAVLVGRVGPRPSG